LLNEAAAVDAQYLIEQNQIETKQREKAIRMEQERVQDAEAGLRKTSKDLHTTLLKMFSPEM